MHFTRCIGFSRFANIRPAIDRIQERVNTLPVFKNFREPLILWLLQEQRGERTDKMEKLTGNEVQWTTKLQYHDCRCSQTASNNHIGNAVEYSTILVTQIQRWGHRERVVHGSLETDPN